MTWAAQRLPSVPPSLTRPARPRPPPLRLFRRRARWHRLGRRRPASAAVRRRRAAGAVTANLTARRGGCHRAGEAGGNDAHGERRARASTQPPRRSRGGRMTLRAAAAARGGLCLSERVSSYHDTATRAACFPQDLGVSPALIASLLRESAECERDRRVLHGPFFDATTHLQCACNAVRPSLCGNTEAGIRSGRPAIPCFPPPQRASHGQPPGSALAAVGPPKCRRLSSSQREARFVSESLPRPPPNGAHRFASFVAKASEG